MLQEGARGTGRAQDGFLEAGELSKVLKDAYVGGLWMERWKSDASGAGTVCVKGWRAHGTGAALRAGESWTGC